MMNLDKIAAKLILLCLLPLVIAACDREQPVGYAADVKPILDENCVKCHVPGGKGLEISGFSMASYADLMKGTKFGPMIIAGDAEGSNLVVLMEGRADPSISMPHGSGKPIPREDIQTIRTWIEQGAKDN